MSERVVTAWSHESRQPVRVCWQDGIVSAIQTVREAPPGLWIAPPLMDLQINGYGGIDFQQDNLTADDLLSAARQLRSAGCATWLLTLITDPWAKLMARLRQARNLRSQSSELRRAILGWHIEGP